MTEETTTPTELDLLKKRADQMGIKYNHKSTVKSLSAKIEAAMHGEEEPVEPSELSSPPEVKVRVEPKEERRTRERQEAERLIRCQITCNDPSFTDWDGKILQAGNSFIGTVKKYIAFNVPYHVPKIIYDNMKEAVYAYNFTVRDQKGREINKTKLVPTYNIQDLPPLTQKELDDLAKRQAMRESAEGDI